MKHHHACKRGSTLLLERGARCPLCGEVFAPRPAVGILARISAEGKTYEARHELKKLGFRWDGLFSEWYRMARDDEIDGIFEAGSETCDGVTLRIEI